MATEPKTENPEQETIKKTEPSNIQNFWDSYGYWIGMVISILVGVVLYVVTHAIIIAILVACLIMCIVSIFMGRKSKLIAGYLAILPLPMNRFYIGNLQLKTILIRIIPVIGTLYDWYAMFWAKTLVPAGGWYESI